MYIRALAQSTYIYAREDIAAIGNVCAPHIPLSLVSRANSHWQSLILQILDGIEERVSLPFSYESLLRPQNRQIMSHKKKRARVFILQFFFYWRSFTNNYYIYTIYKHTQRKCNKSGVRSFRSQCQNYTLRVQLRVVKGGRASCASRCRREVVACEN